MNKLKSMLVKLLRFIFRFQFVEVGGFIWGYWGWTNTIVLETYYKTIRMKPNKKTRQAILNGEFENVAKAWLPDKKTRQAILNGEFENVAKAWLPDLERIL